MQKIKAGLIPRLLLAVLLLAGLTEQTYRIYLFGLAAFSYTRINSVHNLGVSGLIQPSKYPDIGYELKPNLDTFFALAEFRTSSIGIHDEEYPEKKPANTLRIALAGSSYCMPSGVALKDSWHYLVEKKLDALETGRRHEIINFSVGGYVLSQQIATLKRRSFEYQPDLLIVSLTPYSPNGGPVEIERYIPKKETLPFWGSFALQLRHGRRGARYSYLETQLASASALAKRHDVPICFMIINSDYTFKKITERMEEVALKYSPCVIDTTPAFENTNPRKFYIYPLDEHPNSAAQHIFADVIAPYVASRMKR